MFIAALFLMVQIGKNPNTHQWVNRQTMIYSHSGILFSNKNDKLLIHATSWLNLKIIMLNDKMRIIYMTSCI